MRRFFDWLGPEPMYGLIVGLLVWTASDDLTWGAAAGYTLMVVLCELTDATDEIRRVR